MKDEFVMDENGTHWQRPAFQDQHGAWSYDADGHWLVFTEDGGASAIVAYDVPSTWAARMLPLLNVGPPTRDHGAASFARDIRAAIPDSDEGGT